jgi:plastocyanin
MKLFYTAILALLFHCSSNATTWPVSVSNFQFNPATVNAVIGDVIQFTWVAGSFNHTTTCGSGLPGTTIPPGAAEWNSPMNATTTTFSYTVTVEGTYFYGCIPHFISNAMSGTITVSAPLPISFGSFNVTNNDSKALLQWKTLSEANTDYFSIRKSTDATNFYEIGRVNAAGNSNAAITYQFTDPDLGKVYKYLYYEIVTVDADKRQSSSAIKTIRNTSIIKDNIIVSLSPNPVTRPGMVLLKFNADKAGEMDVSVYNSSGQMVLKTKMSAFYGLNNSHLHICDFEKGTYNIVFSLDGKKEIRKVLVL